MAPGSVVREVRCRSCSGRAIVARPSSNPVVLDLINQPVSHCPTRVTVDVRDQNRFVRFHPGKGVNRGWRSISGFENVVKSSQQTAPPADHGHRPPLEHAHDVTAIAP